MKCNVLIITIDSLRANKCFGPKKTAATPNIDGLIKNGFYFTQAISVSDGTYESLGSILTGQHPFNHNISLFENHSNAKINFNELKLNGYHLYATTPDNYFFQTLTSEFDGKDIVTGRPYLRTFEGFGEKIVTRLSSKKMKEPWIYFTHIMDLHVSKPIPNELTDEKYGSDTFDQRLSIIDVWIGKILAKIDMEKTLVILSADHGEFDQNLDNDIGSVPELQKTFRGIKSVSPQFMEPVGVKLFVSIREKIRKKRLKKIQQNMNENEMRRMTERGHDKLYDECLRIPLVFSGFGIKSSRIIDQQVRQIDIFPTITEVIGIPQNVSMNGTSLIPFFQEKEMNQLPAYFEGTPLQNQDQPQLYEKFGKSIGVRTPDYKYYRSRHDSSKNVRLFDLKNDPSEKKNIAESNPEIVIDMEKILQNIQMTKQTTTTNEKISDDEIVKAKKILGDLGYI